MRRAVGRVHERPDRVGDMNKQKLAAERQTCPFGTGQRTWKIDRLSVTSIELMVHLVTFVECGSSDRFLISAASLDSGFFDVFAPPKPALDATVLGMLMMSQLVARDPQGASLSSCLTNISACVLPTFFAE